MTDSSPPGPTPSGASSPAPGPPSAEAATTTATSAGPPPPGRRSNGGLLRRAWSLIALPLVSILLAFGVGSLVIYFSQLLSPDQEFNIWAPFEAYGALLRGAGLFGDVEGLIGSLAKATPLILAGLGVGFAFKAGLFNIGAQGQFLLGALGAVALGGALANSGPIGIPIALVGGMAVGAFWGFIPGFLKAFRGAHEVVTTIMLNYIAYALLAAIVSGPLDVPGSPSPITRDVGDAGLPVLIGRTGHLGIVIALLAAVIVHVFLFRTTRGFEVRAVGANPDAARYAGMRPRFLTVLTMSISGLLAGLGGAVEVLGVTKQMHPSYGTTVGFDAIAVALLGRSNPLGIVLAALLFGAMRQGAALMQIEAGVPVELVDVIQATILLFLVANPVLRRVLRMRGTKSGVGVDEAATITRSYSGEAAVR